jgi:hypothetical protein
MIEFLVQGPIRVEYEINNGIKRIARINTITFWENDLELGHERGCYVFALRKGRAIIPYYVGKACKSFAQEVFTADKLLSLARFFINIPVVLPFCILLFILIDAVKPMNGILMKWRLMSSVRAYRKP